MDSSYSIQVQLRGVLAQVQLRQLALPPPRHRVDRKKDQTKQNVTPALSHDESAPNMCKDSRKQTKLYIINGFRKTNTVLFEIIS